MAWVKPLPYEVNIDEARDFIVTLLKEPIDAEASYFGTYNEAKDRIEAGIKIPQILKRGKKRIEEMRKKLGSTKSPLALTEGKGEDVEEEEKETEENKPKKEK